ncbi:MAG: hypothetical protein NEA02_04460 [Thermoanaerobaculia bacterium]|nr:hypothetical protein [Thermoanaerobaculia bacterium]
MRISTVGLSILFASGALLGAGPEAKPVIAKGTFRSKNLTMDVQSAMAFHGEGLMDKEKKGMLLVVVSNARFVSSVFADYYDRRRAIDRLKDDDTGIVTFEFEPDGKYRGYSFYFASGNGCGYCGGGDVAKVKLSGGRLTGTLKATDEDSDRALDITLDVPVMSDDHGPALPADGGDPVRAYMAYHAALVKRDAAGVKAVLSDNSLKSYERFEKKKEVDRYLDGLAKEHPVKSVRVVRGFAKPDTAVLLIEGESPYSKLSGEALLFKQRGAWRVDDELTEVKLQ